MEDRKTMGLFSRLRRYLSGEDRDARKAVDFGDGLQRLPDPQPLTGMIFDPELDAWITFADAAQRILDLYEDGRWGHAEDLCPRCVTMQSWGNSRFLSTEHPNVEARLRWTKINMEQEGMIAAYGECRCGKKISDSAALAAATTFNAPYLDRYRK